MSEEITIDQVIVRKAGGYNLRTTSWWNELSASNRHEMIANGDVQFFAAGKEVPPAEAASILEGASSATATRETTEVIPSGPVVIPEFDAAPSTAVYTRRVIEGPRWLVTRSDENGEEELYTCLLYTSPSPRD